MEINIQNVSMTYPNGKQALKDLTLDLRTPSLIGLLGPNGAGKTTLMKLLMTALLLLLALGVYLLVLGVTRPPFAQPGSRVI